MTGTLRCLRGGYVHACHTLPPLCQESSYKHHFDDSQQQQQHGSPESAEEEEANDRMREVMHGYMRKLVSRSK